LDFLRRDKKSTLQIAVLELTAEGLSTCLHFLRRDKTAATSGTTTAEDSPPPDSAMNADSRDSYPLHCHRQYIYIRGWKGHPKISPVMVRHQALVNWIKSHENVFTCTPQQFPEHNNQPKIPSHTLDEH
jgi:hypothetical protein